MRFFYTNGCPNCDLALLMEGFLHNVSTLRLYGRKWGDDLNYEYVKGTLVGGVRAECQRLTQNRVKDFGQRKCGPLTHVKVVLRWIIQNLQH